MYVFCNRHSVHSKYLISFPAKRGLALPEDVMLMDLDFGALALVGRSTAKSTGLPGFFLNLIMLITMAFSAFVLKRIHSK